MRSIQEYDKTSEFRQSYGRDMLRNAIGPQNGKKGTATIPATRENGRAFMEILVSVVEQDKIQPAEFPEILGIEHSEYLALKEAYGL